MKDIRYLFYITPKIYFVILNAKLTFNILKIAILF